MQVRHLYYCELKVEHAFPNQSFFHHCSITTMHCQMSFKLCRHYFISASVAVDRRFNAASKKENNIEGMPIHFLIKYFLKKPSPLAHNTDEKNQAPKLLFVTAAVDLVLQLDLRVRKCSNFISMILSNTLL